MKTKKWKKFERRRLMCASIASGEVTSLETAAGESPQKGTQQTKVREQVSANPATAVATIEPKFLTKKKDTLHT